jgi:hypothetical protein
MAAAESHTTKTRRYLDTSYFSFLCTFDSFVPSWFTELPGVAHAEELPPES